MLARVSCGRRASRLGLAPEARVALEALQAQDDDLFVSTSLAELAATHHGELERRQGSAEALDPDAGIQVADGVEDAGGVKKFEIGSTSWQRKLSGELMIKGGKVIGTDFEWTDIDR